MIPIEDENPTYETPYVTYSLILLNVLVFLLEMILSATGQLKDFLYGYGLIASELSGGAGLHTLLTSMFIHGDLAHLLGNMLFLYIFGNNIEDVYGRKRYLAYYLGCGFIASIVQVASDPASMTPTIGASGAIAGILAAYLYIYPRATVKGVFIIGFPFNVLYHLFRGFARFPAYLLIGLWFIVQVIPMEGVAYAAHIAGFAAGLLITRYISLDLDLARKRQEIREKTCMRRMDRKPLRDVDRFLEKIHAGETKTIGEIEEKTGYGREKIEEYLECARDAGYLNIGADGRIGLTGKYYDIKAKNK